MKYLYNIIHNTKILQLIIIFSLLNLSCTSLKNEISIFLVKDEEEEEENKYNIFCNILTREKLRNVNTKQLKVAISMIPYPVIESQENLIKYDVDWKNICGKCNFPFFESL